VRTRAQPVRTYSRLRSYGGGRGGRGGRGGEGRGGREGGEGGREGRGEAGSASARTNLLPRGCIGVSVRT
jgi:hypothetical protein